MNFNRFEQCRSIKNSIPQYLMRLKVNFHNIWLEFIVFVKLTNEVLLLCCFIFFNEKFLEQN
jgi:hypothetical protein